MITREEWNSVYFDRANWIFANLQDLSLDSEEALVLLVLNFYLETRQPVTYEGIAEKCHISLERVDACIETLNAKGYLQMDFRNRRVEFILDGLLDSPVSSAKPVSQPLLMEFQQEFGGSLSSSQMEKILQLADQYEERMVIQALNEAAIYDKRSLEYIEAVLQAWKRRGLSVEDVESGKR